MYRYMNKHFKPLKNIVLWELFWILINKPSALFNLVVVPISIRTV